MIDRDGLAKAFDRAEALRLFDLRALNDVIARNPGHHGLWPLHDLLLALDPRTQRTRSEFEREVLALLEDAGIPAPEVNADLVLDGRHVVADFLWRPQRLILEADGWETHRTRQAFERDRARDALLLRHGYRVIRVTWRQLEDEPQGMVATVRAGLDVLAEAHGALGGRR